MTCKHKYVEDVTTTEQWLDGTTHLRCEDCEAEIIESRVEGWFEEIIPKVEVEK